MNIVNLAKSPLHTKVNQEWYCCTAHPYTSIHMTARISSDAYITDRAQIGPHCSVLGRARVAENASLIPALGYKKGATVEGGARVSGEAVISGNAIVSGDARVLGTSCITENAMVSGNARVHDSTVTGTAIVDENACVDSSDVGGASHIGGNARFRNSATFGTVHVDGYALIVESYMAPGSSASWMARAMSTEINGHLIGKACMALNCCQWPIHMTSHNEISIGCQTHTVKEWLAVRESIIPWAKYHVSKNEKQLIRTIIRGMVRQSLEDKTWKRG